MAQKKLIVVCGPTASGKSVYAVSLAQKCEGEIISADSRQVYRFMDVATAKISKQDMLGIPHHLIDIVNPDEAFTVVDYVKLAREKMNDIWKRRKQPLLVGGTGLYLSAVLEGYDDFGSVVVPSIRQKLENLSLEDLQIKLRLLDPSSFAKVDIKNKRRVIRALEKSESVDLCFLKKGDNRDCSYTPYCPSNGQQEKRDSPLSCINHAEHGFAQTMLRETQLGGTIAMYRGTTPENIELELHFIQYPREVLYNFIEQRIDRMIESGVLDEVKRLGKQYGWDLPSMSGLGYRQLGNYLRGLCGFDEALRLFRRDTRRYAKRQLTWFRNKILSLGFLKNSKPFPCENFR